MMLLDQAGLFIIYNKIFALAASNAFYTFFGTTVYHNMFLISLASVAYPVDLNFI